MDLDLGDLPTSNPLKNSSLGIPSQPDVRELRESRALGALQEQQAENEKLSRGKRARRQISMSHVKDVQPIREISKQLKVLAGCQRNESTIKASEDSKGMMARTKQIKREEQMKLLLNQTIMTIMDPEARKEVLRNQIMAKLVDEKEATRTLIAHKEHIMQLVWNRQLATRKELSSLFREGSANLL